MSDNVIIWIAIDSGQWIKGIMPKELADKVVNEWVNDPDNAQALLRIMDESGFIYGACQYKHIRGMQVSQIDTQQEQIEKDRLAASIRHTEAVERFTKALEKQTDSGNEWKGDDA